MIKKFLLPVLAVGIVTSAMAALTPINTPWDGTLTDTEVNLAGGPGVNILSEITTGSHLNYGVNGYTFDRIDDSSDQLWTTLNNNAGVLFTAVYAGYDNELGYYNGHTGGSYTALGNPSGSGNANFDFVLGQSALLGNIGDFRWAIDVRDLGTTYYTSRQADNPLSSDQMVTWRLRDASGALTNKYLIGIEDQIDKDEDFNDLVFIAEFVKPVPVPGAALLGVLGISLLSALKRKLS